MEIHNPDLERFRWERLEQIQSELTANPDSYQNREMSEATTRTLMDESAEDNDSMDIDIDELDEAEFHNSEQDQHRVTSDTSFKIATDFGTTMSSVAFVKTYKGKNGQLLPVEDWPYDPMIQGKKSLEVPTESWYAEKPVSRAPGVKYSRLLLEDDLFANLYDEDSDGEATRAKSLSDRRSDSSEDDGGYANGGLLDDESYVWGFGVQDRLGRPDGDEANYRRIARSKLLLDKRDETKDIRNKLLPILRKLARSKTIRPKLSDGIVDLIADFLTRLFQHTKRQLVSLHGLSESDKIEHVICVPNGWTADACRKMQMAMEIAIKASGLGTMENLFIVSEPEAGAEYIIGKSSIINRDESFLILDAGGGTVDATTYKVTRTYPLHLEREEVEPQVAICGSSYLNEKFRDHLQGRLEEEGLDSLESIIDGSEIEFENVIKRKMKFSRKPRELPGSAIRVYGLQENALKRFRENYLVMERADYQGIFHPILVKIELLMIDQLQRAMASARVRVKKVVLIGGFACSTLLRLFLGRQLAEFSEVYGQEIHLVNSLAPENAVAIGALMRVLNKGDGPSRIIQSSYGFLRTVPFEPKLNPEQVGIRPRIDKLDGIPYVNNTIDGLVKKGELILPKQEFCIPVCHTFLVTKTQFLCEEVLFVSDTSTQSNYRSTHPKNKGAEIAGKIVTDMTFLRTEGLIQPIDPEDGARGKRHYKVEFELVMTIDGRNLSYAARYPPGRDGQVLQKGQVSIAAAFVPGTN